QTVTQIVDAILALPGGRRLLILAPVIRDRRGEHQQVFDDARRAGYVRVRVDGAIHDLGEEFSLEKNKRHSIEVVVDRLVTEESETAGDSVRVADSVEQALKLGAGTVLVSVEGEPERLFSEHFA